MFERIIQIIVYVLNSLKADQNIDAVDIKELSQLGYSEVEISTAISWLVDKAEFDKLDEIFTTSYTTNSNRIFHESEIDLFTKEALGELIQLQSLKVLNNSQVELLIEKALFSGVTKLDLITLRQVVAGMIFNVSNNIESNKRLMLFGNESIN
jgi:uncharacterized protein Smg (DUF494 family)